MRKGQIHFSNQFDQLIPILGENLFPKGSKPFDQRLIIIPHLSMKNAITRELAKDSALGVAAGFRIENLNRGYEMITGKKIPNQMELALWIQHTLMKDLEEFPECNKYFSEAKFKRMGPFCERLAANFIKYIVYGKPALPNWQEKLWEKWGWKTGQWKNRNVQVHLFGFSYLPRFYLDFFSEGNAQFYFFSPCHIYWGDFYSEKQRGFMRKSASTQQLSFLEESFSDQNPFLTSWGQIGRKIHLHVEEMDFSTQEWYRESAKSHALGVIQNQILEGQSIKVASDESIKIVSATSIWRELEICKDQICQLCTEKRIEPKQIRVFAPDINPYVPFIHAIFADLAYSISDVALPLTDPIAGDFIQFIRLPKKRFEVSEVLQVLAKLKGFSIDLALIRSWLEVTGVRWGSSKMSRFKQYLQNYPAKEICENANQGTWAKGFELLLDSLGQVDMPEWISTTQIEELDGLYRLFTSLADDLAPLYDGTEWTIPTWLRFFACLLETYFAIDPSHSVYKSLNQFAASLDHLDQKTLPFEGIENTLNQILTTSSGSHQPPHLQAIHFGSLKEGCVSTSKAIFLLGMQEEGFPRVEKKNSIDHIPIESAPKQGDVDRYVFLQTLCLAKECFFVSYVRDPEGKWGASVLVDELAQQIDGAQVIHHPAQSYNPEYFGGKLISYDQKAFQIAREKQQPKPFSPLIPEFYTSTCLQQTPLEEMEIPVSKLFKFAKHPLRYYFHEILELYPNMGRESDAELVLNPLVKHKIIQTCLTQGVESAFKQYGHLFPTHLLEPLAKKQVYDEVQKWERGLGELDIRLDELTTKKIDIQCGQVSIRGKLTFCTEQTVFIMGEHSLEDKIRFLPHALIAKELVMSFVFLKSMAPYIPDLNLEQYLTFFQLGSRHACPFLPKLCNAFVKGTFTKEFLQMDDEIFQFLFFRDPPPDPKMIIGNWEDHLSLILGGDLASV